MKRFASVLLPLDGSPEAAKAVRCALWLAEKLGATLHVLHATSQPRAGREAFAQLRLPEAARAQVVVHEVRGPAQQAVLQAVREYQVELVVMSAGGESVSMGAAPRERVGSVARAVLEDSPVPVVLLPGRYNDEKSLPWRAMLVAASGEPAADRALETAAQLASALGLRVQVLHSRSGPSGKGAYADAAHHEYAPQLEDMVESGLAACSIEESCCVEPAMLRCGDPALVLLQQVLHEGIGVLTLGWHGVLDRGRALILKRLLEEAPCALLLVRSSEHSAARLKVGEEMDG